MRNEEISNFFCQQPPDLKDWTRRRNHFFDYGLKFYNITDRVDIGKKFYALENELERAYCSGCYLACIMISKAIIEYIEKKAEKIKILTDYKEKLFYCSDAFSWIHERRKNLFHSGSKEQSNSISRSEMFNMQEELERDAVKACSAIYYSARAFVQTYKLKIK
ncbi:MAG: hypothetical protein R3E90_02305 [Marinicella sp.]|nr:hypothetical protein [Xanthomonadales bacterium]